jgi:hypothetical protein
MVGYSGGSIGGEWAAELQSSYAPELRIAGAAIGRLPANITEAILPLDGSPFAGLIYSAFNGISNALPNFAAYIEKYLLPCKADMFRIPVLRCQSEPTKPDYGFLSGLANTGLASFFDNGDSIIHDQAQAFNSIGVNRSVGTLTQSDLAYWVRDPNTSKPAIRQLNHQKSLLLPSNHYNMP